MISSFQSAKGRYLPFALAIALGVVVFFLFAGVVNFDFVNWDDDLYVYNNPDIRALNFSNLNLWSTRSYVSLYVPLPMLSYALDYSFYGNHAGGFHRTNLILHAANAILVFFILLFFLSDALPAFLGALLFSVHPVQVETVAWISERKTLLCAFFYLSSFLLFVRKQDRRGRISGKGALIILLFAAALFSKITAVMGLAVFIAHDHYFSREISGRKKLFYVLGFLAVALASAATLNLYPRVLALLAAGKCDNLFALQADRFLFYLKSVFWPAGLRAVYPYGEVFLNGPMGRGITAVLLAFLGVSLFYSLSAKRKSGFWMVWFFAFLAPTVTLFPVPLGDRHLYLPLLGVIAFFLVLLRRTRLPLIILLLAAISASVPASLSALPAWRDGGMLWGRVLKFTPDDFQANMKLANFYEARKENEKAVAVYRRVIEKYPRAFPFPYLNLYNIFVVSGQSEGVREIEALFRSHYPEAPDLEVLYRILRDLKKVPRQGIRFLDRAMDPGEGNPGALILAGEIYLKAGKIRKARECYDLALSLQPEPGRLPAGSEELRRGLSGIAELGMEEERRFGTDFEDSH